MFNIYIQDFKRGNENVSTEELVQTVPAESEGALKLISPIIKNDMGNAESFNFNIESGTQYYDAFQQMKTYFRVEYDDTTIFYGRVLTIDNGFYGTRKIRLEGPLAFFNDSPVEGVKETSRKKIDPKEYLEDLIKNHNDWIKDSKRSFKLGEVPGYYTSNISEEQQVIKNSDVSKKERKYGSDSWTDTKSALEDLRSHYGGYFRVRIDPTDQNTPLILDWMNHYFNAEHNTQSVEIGKNILDINTVTEIDNIFTVLVPIGTNSKSSNSSGKNASSNFYIDGKELTVPSVLNKYTKAQLNSGYHKYEDYRDALDKYGRIVKTVVFDDAKNKSDLETKAYEWIKNNYQGEVTKFTVKAIDMHQIGENTQKIMVGDRVRLIYPVGKEDGTTELSDTYQTCLSIQYDLYNPENNQYTFGIPANILTKTYGVTKQSKSVTSGTKKKPTDTKSDGEKEQDWLSEVYSWLQNHTIWYKHNGGPLPYTDAFKGYMGGPYQGTAYRKNWLLSHEDIIGGNFTIWRVSYSSGWDTTKDARYQTEEAFLEEYNRLKSLSEYGAKQFYDYYHQRSWDIWNPGITYVSAFTSTVLINSNLIEYVKDEYGIDLRTGLAVKMPDKLTLDDGSQLVTVTNTNEETGEEEVFTKEIYDSKTGCTIFYNENGEQITSWRDSNGYVHYYIDDPSSPTGYKETTDRALAFQTLDNATQHGQLVQAYFRNPVYVMEDDPDNPGKKRIKRDALGVPIQAEDPTSPDGLAWEKYTDGENAGKLKLEPYAYMFAQAIERYDEGSLVIARVDGDKVVLGGPHTKYQTRLALKNISDVCGNFYTETDEHTGEEKIVIIDGTGLVQNMEDENGNIYQAGYFHDGNLTGGVVVQKLDGEVITRINGQNIRVGDNNTLELHLTAQDLAEFGLVDGDPNSATYGQLTGGMLVSKLNGQTITRINGQNIKVGGSSTIELHLTAQDLAEFGLVDVNTGTLTGGMIVSKLNDQSTTTKIKGDRIVLGTLNNTDLNTWAKDANDGTGVFAKYLTVKKLNATEISTMFLQADFPELGHIHADGFTLNDGYADINPDGQARFVFVDANTLATDGHIITIYDADKSNDGSTLNIYKTTDSNPISFTRSAISNITKSADGKTLTITPFNGNSWTFEKAASVDYLVSNWSGSTLTISTSPDTNKTLTVGFGGTVYGVNLMVYSDTDRTTSYTYDSSTGKCRLTVPVKVSSLMGSAPYTATKRYETIISTDVTDVYEAGMEAASVDYLVSNWSGSTLTISTSPDTGKTFTVGFNSTRYGVNLDVYNDSSRSTSYTYNSSTGKCILTVPVKISSIMSSPPYTTTTRYTSVVNGDATNVYTAGVTAGENNITSNGKAAATYYPSTTDQTIASGQYLSGDQTIKAVTFNNLTAANIKRGTVVTVGDTSNPTRLKNITGTFTGTVSSGQTKATASQIATGYSAYIDGAEVKGSMTSKSAATYYPSISDQTISANQFLTGDQTIKAVTFNNLSAANIKKGTVVTVGDASNPTRLKNITGSCRTWAEYWSSTYWEKPSKSNGWICYCPNEAGTGKYKWFDIDDLGYSSSTTVSNINSGVVGSDSISSMLSNRTAHYISTTMGGKVNYQYRYITFSVGSTSHIIYFV